MNVLSFWLQVPWNPTNRATLEVGGIGTYDPASCVYLDGVVERAENLGVRLLPSIWAHPHARDVSHPWADPGEWQRNPYRELGTVADFYRVADAVGNPTPQWIAQTKLYRYMMARWGTSPAIIGWVAIVEANGTNGWIPGDANQVPVATWTSAVRDYFASIDSMRRNGVAYPITTSLTRDIFDASAEPKILDIDERPLHLLGSDSYEAEGSNDQIARFLGEYQKSYDREQKLGIITEWGAFNDVTSDHPVAVSVPLHLHDGLWAVVGAGGTIAPLLWADELAASASQHFALPDATMRAEFKRIGIFFGLLNTVPGRVFDSANLSTTLSSTGGLSLHRATTTAAGVAWLRTDNRANLAAGPLTVPGVQPSVAYLVTWFDTARDATDDDGVEVEVTSTAGGDLTMTLPLFAASRPDVALFFRLKLPAALIGPSGPG